jgi:hypothetical protein
LKSIGEVYGDDILVDTNLPWISVVEPPGMMELLSPSEFRARLSGREVLVVYGSKAEPWESAMFCKSRFPEIGHTALVIPVSSTGQPSVGSYEDRQETFWGPLFEHFHHRTSQGYEQAILLIATLRIIAEAIERPFDELTQMNWVRRDQTICTRLVPEEIGAN